jgi:macrolide-specific efflux system membrane fusion protein
MSASAEVIVEQVKNAVTVTSEAVKSGPSKTVTVKEESGKEVQKVVTTGLVGNETTQILTGLQPGETVVLPELKVATGGGEGAATGGFPGGGLAKGGFPFAGGGGFAGARPGG